jgi:hypothetical protein
MWNRKSATIGPLKPQQSALVIFKFDGDIALIGNGRGGYDLTTSCGCTSANWDSASKTMTLKFTARDIPHHLADKGEYSSSQHVTFPCIIDGVHQEETLQFRAVIKQNF